MNDKDKWDGFARINFTPLAEHILTLQGKERESAIDAFFAEVRERMLSEDPGRLEWALLKGERGEE